MTSAQNCPQAGCTYLAHDKADLAEHQRLNQAAHPDLDTVSSASRQHYIDTGEYLPVSPTDQLLKDGYDEISVGPANSRDMWEVWVRAFPGSATDEYWDHLSTAELSAIHERGQITMWDRGTGGAWQPAEVTRPAAQASAERHAPQPTADQPSQSGAVVTLQQLLSELASIAADAEADLADANADLVRADVDAHRAEAMAASLRALGLDQQTLGEVAALADTAILRRSAAQRRAAAAETRTAQARRALTGVQSRHQLMAEAYAATPHAAVRAFYLDSKCTGRSAIPIGTLVTARNPGGGQVEGIYIGPGNRPGTVAIDWSRQARRNQVDGAGRPTVDILSLSYIGSFPVESMREVPQRGAQTSGDGR